MNNLKALGAAMRLHRQYVLNMSSQTELVCFIRHRSSLCLDRHTIYPSVSTISQMENGKFVNGSWYFRDILYYMGMSTKLADILD